MVFPGLIVVGLIAIPYIDKNPLGNGYYTFAQRRFAITTFMFGFVILWVVLIIFGTFLRGPNWNFFGPYEYWDIHKLVPLTNLNLSEIVWIKLLERPLPGTFLGSKLLGIFLRESVGLFILFVYFGILPPILARIPRYKGIYEKLGGPRFYTVVLLALTMLTLPAKMYLRWWFNLKYIVAIPEWFLNF